ncbi:hypothetical protein XELAEV_18047176mg [Xenopus laevis]|uniref:Uncharacterized protein n=1 Tax=Xenopus laevis TaxID=8355 RepID=A0A974BUI2_XENLA|nr:hypothetical protein XELAEV_18047176mg [Xenopus laevis]
MHQWESSNRKVYEKHKAFMRASEFVQKTHRLKCVDESHLNVDGSVQDNCWKSLLRKPNLYVQDQQSLITLNQTNLTCRMLFHEGPK